MNKITIIAIVLMLLVILQAWPAEAAGDAERAGRVTWTAWASPYVQTVCIKFSPLGPVTCLDVDVGTGPGFKRGQKVWATAHSVRGR
jgi:hypothetical protein